MGLGSFEDEARTGRWPTAVTQENVHVVEKLIGENRRITYVGLERESGIGSARPFSLDRRKGGSRSRRGAAVGARWSGGRADAMGQAAAAEGPKDDDDDDLTIRRNQTNQSLTPDRSSLLMQHSSHLTFRFAVELRTLCYRTSARKRGVGGPGACVSVVAAVIHLAFVSGVLCSL
ncbi:hypothetical protein EVAR_9495_1 [Eumeta japonica]|uniref:Uncharacterized protein n=1 Tax=Eumeta variegata TaxID=151549 RepID=A0A4C1U514_EUMVA|nr:hypothetical protein EVAR_9495_1 [Eumeta japonica]